jgi:hypothetical protein
MSFGIMHPPPRQVRMGRPIPAHVLQAARITYDAIRAVQPPKGDFTTQERLTGRTWGFRTVGAHGGSIGATSMTGRGTTHTVTLPYHYHADLRERVMPPAAGMPESVAQSAAQGVSDKSFDPVQGPSVMRAADTGRPQSHLVRYDGLQNDRYTRRAGVGSTELDRQVAV